jgi:dihydroorotate dehydrogenase (NAD+) catalytic subunit
MGVAEHVSRVNSLDLSINLGRLKLPNPILTASGTFGYAREMESFVDFSRLGGVIPKTITAAARIGNRPWRTVETAAGMLNAIGLDNDGIDDFLQYHLPYLSRLPTQLIVSVAGRTEAEFVDLARRIGHEGGVAAVELNISCPNVSGGVDFGTDPDCCHRLVRAAVAACPIPIIAKLTPNVTRIADIAQAAENAGADAVSVINTVQGLAVDWRNRRPLLGNILGGLSGPAIKPIALRCVYQVRQQCRIPIIGIGGIATIDDVMEFLVTGATAVQIGTANYYEPGISAKLVDQLPAALTEFGATSIREIIGTLNQESISVAKDH